MNSNSLGATPTSSEVKDFCSRFGIRLWHPGGENILKTLPVVVVLGVIVVIISTAPNDSLKLAMSILFAVFGLIVIVMFALLMNGKRDNVKKGIQVERYAKSNGWTYEYESKTLRHPSTVLSTGRDHVFMHVVQGTDFQVAECLFRTGSGRSEQTHHYGYMALTLERPLPHMVLDSKSNNMKIFGIQMSNLPITLSKDQVVSLEGDFDKYFTLYAPEKYGSDVRYVFTPDLMHVLIQESDSTDMEIVDDKLFVYFGGHNLANTAFWERVHKLRATLGSKLVERVDRYTDGRTTDGSLASEGTRLKKGVPILIIIILIIYGIQFALELWSSLQ